MNSDSTVSEITAIDDAPMSNQPILRQIYSLGRQIIACLTCSYEPTITRIYRNGKLFWQIYDPRSNQHIICVSKTEVRSWLETVYFHF